MRSISDVLAHLFHPRFSNNHRPRLLHPEGFAVLSVLAVFLTIIIQVGPNLKGTGSILGFSSSITPAKVVESTNLERAKLGLTPLSLNSQLSSAAVAKASDMFQDQYWAHFSPSGKSPWEFISNSGYSYQVAGENLARDFLHTDEMLQAWMNSPTHRENIVSSEYKEIGVGVVDGVLNGVETTLVVQMFGTARVPNQVARIDPAPAPVAEPVIIVEDSPVISPSPALVIEQPGGPEIPQATLLPAPVQLATAQLNASPIAINTDQRVLSSSLQRMIEGERPPLLSPLHVSKAFFLAITLLVVSALSYDMMVVENLKTLRFVGRNFAHIVLFSIVFFLILLFKGGVIR